MNFTVFDGSDSPAFEAQHAHRYAGGAGWIVVDRHGEQRAGALLQGGFEKIGIPGLPAAVPVRCW